MKRKKKRCFHKDGVILWGYRDGNIQSSVVTQCKKCGKLYDSVKVGSKWVKGKEADLVVEKWEKSLGRKLIKL